VQAEQAQNEALLLNIVRASMRRPMQFSTVSSITGTAVASAGAGYTLPTNVPFRPATNGATGIATFPPVPTWSFAGSMSGGPAFTIPVLDTQEFYQGILKPIPGQLYDLYLQAGYPPDLLFNLFVKKITMTRFDKECQIDSYQLSCQFQFDNYPSSPLEIDLFQAVADYLLALGFTTEAEKPVTVEFKNAQNINVRYVGAPSGGEDKNMAQVVAPPGGSAAEASLSQPRPYAFCFAPRTLSDVDCVGGPNSPELCAAPEKPKDKRLNNWLACHSSTPIYIKRFFPDAKPPEKSGAKGAENSNVRSSDRSSVSPSDSSGASAESNRLTLGSEDFEADTPRLQASGKSKLKVIISEGFARELHHLAQERGEGDVANRLIRFADQPVDLTITTRSTEGMIYYVGEVARRQLDNPDFNTRGPVFIKVGKPFAPYPLGRCTQQSDSCAYLFRIKKDSPGPDDFLSVAYNGQWYSVLGGPFSEVGFSSQVLDVLRQQIAVNSSAKSLPQSSVISLVGGQ
jgi:hypothetical protein